MMKAHFILYVADQRRSAAFYQSVLGEPPTLDVPGMTEFELAQGAVLGLMPEDGIARILGPGVAHPSSARGAPRSELYLVVDDATAVHERAVASGAREVSPPAERDWGDVVGYSLDPDGHVLAVASMAAGAA
jgi:predicted enzyme related to lactoylglutathione lyase